MFVGILLRDLARDFGVEFERLRHREIFEISAHADKKLQGATLMTMTFLLLHTVLAPLTRAQKTQIEKGKTTYECLNVVNS